MRAKLLLSAIVLLVEVTCHGSSLPFFEDDRFVGSPAAGSYLENFPGAISRPSSDRRKPNFFKPSLGQPGYVRYTPFHAIQLVPPMSRIPSESMTRAVFLAPSNHNVLRVESPGQPQHTAETTTSFAANDQHVETTTLPVTPHQQASGFLKDHLIPPQVSALSQYEIFRDVQDRPIPKKRRKNRPKFQELESNVYSSYRLPSPIYHPVYTKLISGFPPPQQLHNHQLTASSSAVPQNGRGKMKFRIPSNEYVTENNGKYKVGSVQGWIPIIATGNQHATPVKHVIVNPDDPSVNLSEVSDINLQYYADNIELVKQKKNEKVPETHQSIGDKAVKSAGIRKPEGVLRGGGTPSALPQQWFPRPAANSGPYHAVTSDSHPTLSQTLASYFNDDEDEENEGNDDGGQQQPASAGADFTRFSESNLHEAETRHNVPTFVRQQYQQQSVAISTTLPPMTLRSSSTHQKTNTLMATIQSTDAQLNNNRKESYAPQQYHDNKHVDNTANAATQNMHTAEFTPPEITRQYLYKSKTVTCLSDNCSSITNSNSPFGPITTTTYSTTMPNTAQKENTPSTISANYPEVAVTSANSRVIRFSPPPSKQDGTSMRNEKSKTENEESTTGRIRDTTQPAGNNVEHKQVLLVYPTATTITAIGAT